MVIFHGKLLVHQRVNLHRKSSKCLLKKLEDAHPIDISKQTFQSEAPHRTAAPHRALHTARSLSFLHRFGQLWERLQGRVAVPRDVDLGDHGDATLLSIAQHLPDVVVAIKAAIPQGDQIWFFGEKRGKPLD